MNYFLLISFVFCNGVIASVNALTCYECSILQKESTEDFQFKNHTCNSTLVAIQMKQCSPDNNACGLIVGNTSEGYNIVIRTCLHLSSNETQGVKDYQDMFQIEGTNYSVNGQLNYCNSTGCNNGSIINKSLTNHNSMPNNLVNDSTTDSGDLTDKTDSTTANNISSTEKPGLTTKKPYVATTKNGPGEPNPEINGGTNIKFDSAILLIISTLLIKYFF